MVNDTEMGDVASQAGGETTAALNSIANDKISVDRDKVIDWIEADLWKRFEKRLWSIVSTFLILASIAGLIGIPYYIRNETKKAFEKQSSRYADEQRQFMSMAKDYFYLNSMYINYRESFRADLSSALRDVIKFDADNPSKDQIQFFQSPAQLFKKLLLEQKYVGILHADFIKQELNRPVSPRYTTLILSRQEDIDLENRVLDAVGGTSVSHPFRRGDLAGFLNDIKMKIVILSAYEQALLSMQREIFRLGGDTDLAKQTRQLESETETSSVFLPFFNKFFVENSEQLKLPLQGSDGKPDQDRAKRLLTYYIQEAGIDPAGLVAIDTISKSSLATTLPSTRRQ